MDYRTISVLLLLLSLFISPTWAKDNQLEYKNIVQLGVARNNLLRSDTTSQSGTFLITESKPPLTESEIEKSAKFAVEVSHGVVPYNKALKTNIIHSKLSQNRRLRLQIVNFSSGVCQDAANPGPNEDVLSKPFTSSTFYPSDNSDNSFTVHIDWRTSGVYLVKAKPFTYGAMEFGEAPRLELLMQALENNSLDREQFSVIQTTSTITLKLIPKAGNSAQSVPSGIAFPMHQTWTFSKNQYMDLLKYTATYRGYPIRMIELNDYREVPGRPSIRRPYDVKTEVNPDIRTSDPVILTHFQRLDEIQTSGSLYGLILRSNNSLDEALAKLITDGFSISPVPTTEISVVFPKLADTYKHLFNEPVQTLDSSTSESSLSKKGGL